MKKEFLFAILMPMIVQATVVVWNGQLADNISYTDSNINITGDVTLGLGTTTISAINNDVSIYVSNKSKFYSHDTTQSILKLEAIWPHKITIIVAETLKFAGVNGALNLPIIIEEWGDGYIEWIVQEGKSLIFGSTNDRGGTHLKIVYDVAAQTMPSHIFKPRLHHEQIRFERHSKLIYKELNVSGPHVIAYAIINAFNNNNDHSTHIQFSDGAAIKYERSLIIT